MRYRDTEMSLSEIALELGVEALIDGSVLREGNQIQVRAQLVDPISGNNIWARSFDRGLTSLLALYGELARTIAGEIHVTLTPEEEGRLAQAREVDPEAYDAYLQGRFHWQKLTPEGQDLAMQYFELALEKDSTFVLAYAGLSSVWGARGQVGVVDPREARSKANEYARRAIELDDGVAEAHHALAGHLTWREWEWEEAWHHWRRAIELNPNDARANAFYAHFLAIMGRPEDALPFAERAVAQDPFSALYQALYGITLIFNGRFDEAIAAGITSREIDPTMPIDPREWAYIATGRQEEHIDIQREWYAPDPESLAALERGLAEGGYQGAHLAVADLQASRYGHDVFQPTVVGNLYLFGGDLDRAMAWFERGVEVKEPNMPYIGLPIYDPIRSHSRYPDLIRSFNFPEEVQEYYLTRPRAMGSEGG
jgi:tetratricopeptide (TPR) repeat protein